ncbi:MAG: ABC transporter permease [Rhizobiales bacterium]|nr:ABC transporter permease [Hyphomicrobiales bacterium]
MTQLEQGLRMAKHNEVAASPTKAIEAPKRRKPLADRPLAVVAGWIVLAGLMGGLWEWAGRSGQVNPLFISYPSAIGRALLKGLHGDLITVDARYTFVAVFLGFAGAAVLGIAVAFALAQNAYLKKVVDPFLTALNSLPRVALAPLFLMWFGIGLFSHVLMAASLTFFVVLANTTAGIESVDQDHLLLARLQGATRWQTFRLFIVPSALPGIFVGLELGFIFGTLGTVSGEMIVGEHGLGVRLSRDAGIFDTADYFGTLFALVVISALLTFCFQITKNRLLGWQRLHVVQKSH